MYNPFNPSFGEVPSIFIDRSEIARKLIKELDNPNTPYKSTIIYGMRGVGKTTFLTQIGNELSKQKKWIVANLAMGLDLFPYLINELYNQSPTSIKKLFSQIEGFSVSVLGLQIGADFKQATPVNYQNIVKQLITALSNKGIHVLITIDEVKPTKDLQNLVILFQLLKRQKVSVYLMMTGLPEDISELQNGDINTFLLRSERISLSSLNLSDIKYSYSIAFQKGNISVTDQTLNQLSAMTKGYSYAFQLLGYLIWNEASGQKKIDSSTIKNIKGKYLLDLDRNSYSKIYSSLSAQDKKFLIAMADSTEENIRIKDIREKLGKKSNYISIYRQRLLDDQVIFSPSYGYLSFTLPYFKEFILQQKAFSD